MWPLTCPGATVTAAMLHVLLLALMFALLSPSKEVDLHSVQCTSAENVKQRQVEAREMEHWQRKFSMQTNRVVNCFALLSLVSSKCTVPCIRPQI